MTEPVDLAIVGGGPAGQAAAEQVSAAGLRVAILDEQPRMGGQILRQPPTSFTVTRWMSGAPYRKLHAQIARTAAATGVEWLGGTSVLGIFPADGGASVFRLITAERGEIRARRVLIAAGCYDMPVPFAGWTLPGVMSAGGVQAFVKSQQIVPGHRFVFVGTHPLQLLVADQIVRAGGKVAGVLFPQPLGRALPVLLRHGLAAARQPGPLADAAGAFFRLRRARVPVRFGWTIVRALGEQEVEGVILRGPAGSRGEEIRCDRIATCFGFLPQADLPRQMGCAGERDPRTGGWNTLADGWMRSSIPGVFAAGETVGVQGAEIALCEGRLAGLGILLDSGVIDAAEADRRATPIRRSLGHLRGFATLLAELADPAAFLPALDDDDVVCRCEGVTRGTLVGAMRQPADPGGPSALKLVSRAGMGVCQGRYCEHSVIRLVKDVTGAAPSSGFTARFPVRPVAIGDLIRDQAT